jgi:hypothetical protein
MSADNVTPIGAAKATPRAVAVRIEMLRQRCFRAMSFVETTRRALDQDEQLSERQTLEAAWEILDKVAQEMNEISGISGPIEAEEDA